MSGCKNLLTLTLRETPSRAGGTGESEPPEVRPGTVAVTLEGVVEVHYEMATVGDVRWIPSGRTIELASPKEKMPPSEATIQ